MRRWDFNLAIAIAISLAAHVMLFPAARRFHVALGTRNDAPRRQPTQVTLLLGEADSIPDPPLAKKPPNAQEEPPPPDEIGESTGTGTGAHRAKGDTPLIAPKADQDQAFLSRDPVGAGKVGELPVDYAGPRGQNGAGGQQGSAGSNVGPAARPAPASAVPQPQPEQIKPPDDGSTPQPNDASAAVRSPKPNTPAADQPIDKTPPPAKVVSSAAAEPDVSKPSADEVKASDPLAGPKTTDAGPLARTVDEGPSVAFKPAIGATPPVPEAPREKGAVVAAPDLPVPKAAVAVTPATAADPSPAPSKPPEKAAAKPVTVASAVAPQSSARVATGDGLAPGPNRAQADPAQESESESDPFSKIISADVLHDGRLEVRQGRKVKTTRPHLLLGAQVDLFSMRNPTVVLKIAIDATGRVTSADVIQSSGSTELDQPCRVAVYDWWFEPSRDKRGRPIADVVVFTIRFH